MKTMNMRMESQRACRTLTRFDKLMKAHGLLSLLLLLLLFLWFLLNVADHQRVSSPSIIFAFAERHNLSSSLVIEQLHHLSSTSSLSDQILKDLSLNGTTPCHNTRTAGVVLRTSWDSSHSTASDHHHHLTSDTWYTFTLISMTSSWTPRCAGGDYYEVSLEGHRWRSRPLLEDRGNGTYAGKFMVPSDFTGEYNFSVYLLFDAYHGLDPDPQAWVLGYKSLDLHLIIQTPATPPPVSVTPERCDFPLNEWTGYWSRGWYNRSCDFDMQGRFLCLYGQNRRCPENLCLGNVDNLESNGWVYRRTDCVFKLWSSVDAWKCLHGKWIFFWGDSNHADTARNLLFHVLGYGDSASLSEWQLPRSLDRVFSNPDKPEQWIRITLLYNGHVDMDKFGMGLGTMFNESYREKLAGFFTGKVTPDVVIMNSGLHDGFRFEKVPEYVEAVEYTVKFWEEEIWKKVGERVKFVYRTTVAPAGHSRSMKSNPWKMEVYNRIMVDRVRRSFIPFRLVDGFELTFPWHFDNRFSDGGHYGRAPLSNNWPWHGAPHFYFVDLMLAHILLNVVCES